jgi:glycosyltransferase involved in cell wall biosynthesis
MKTVSVIISAYQAGEFIADAIGSVLGQRLPRGYSLELLVGVDGCAKTWTALSAQRHPSMTFCRMAYNYGPYITFNTLMRLATGDLIKQVNILQNKPNIGIIRTWSVYTDMRCLPVAVRLANGVSTPVNGERRACSHGQLMMRREVWKRLGGYKPWRCSADTDFINRAKFSGIGMHEVQDFLYIRRIHEGSLTQNQDTGHGSSLRQAYVKLMNRDIGRHLAAQRFDINPRLGYIEKIIQ